jgi:hypothetical protein
MDPLPNEQNFDLDKSRQKFHHSLKEHHKTLISKARRTRAHLSRVLVIRDKLDRQNILVCGQHLRQFRHYYYYYYYLIFFKNNGSPSA